MARTIYHKTVLTGGGADSLDNIDGTGLLDKDVAFITSGTTLYVYMLDADSAAAESSPNVIKPDTNAGDKRWILQGVSVAGLSGTNTGDETAARIATIITGAGAETTPLDDDEFPFYKIVGTLLKKVTWANIKATLKTYFDGLYNNYTHPSGDGNLHVPANSTTNSGKVLTAGASAGTYTWETPSAVDLASPGAIGETTPGTIRGKNKEIYKTANADSPLTAAECSGTIVSNYGMTDADCVIDLPTAEEGLAFVCILPAVRARYFRLRCPSAQSDKINLLTSGAWVAGSDDGYVGVASGYAANVCISMFCAKVSDGGFEWFAMPVSGTWVAG